jgi:hypothetical protein
VISFSSAILALREPQVSADAAVNISIEFMASLYSLEKEESLHLISISYTFFPPSIPSKQLPKIDTPRAISIG